MNEKWISSEDTSQLKKGHLYLVYGDQLNSHCPGMDIAKWNGVEFVDWDDESYFYRDYEIDLYLDILKLDPPKEIP